MRIQDEDVQRIGMRDGGLVSADMLSFFVMFGYSLVLALKICIAVDLRAIQISTIKNCVCENGGG